MELKGYLKPIILKLLSLEDEKTGSELAEEIEDLIGSKPSYGSIYPILQDLRERKLVEIKKEGKGKNYILLDKGERFVKELEKKKRENTENLLETLRTFKTLYADEDIELLIENIEKRKGQEGPKFLELQQIQHMLLTRDIEGREEEIRGILEESLERLTEVLED